MKLKYFFAALAAVFTLGLIVSCGEDFEPTYQDGLTVSQSSVAISTEGGSATIDVNAADAWTIENIPAWLTVTPASGSAGTTQVTFSAEANAAGQTGEVVIKMGDKEQHIKVYQGVPTVTAATCAEVLKGIDGKSYLVTGVVTKIAESATYGNFYINDGTGEVYIYGTLYDGKTKQGALLKYGIEVGDEVTVQGPRKDYNGTIELVDVEVVKVNKSLLKLDSITVNNDNIAADLEKQPLAKEGSDFTVHLACKTANGISVAVPEDAQSWLSIKSINGSNVTFHAAANNAGARSTTLTFTTTDGSKDYTAQANIIQDGSIQEVSVAEFLAAPVGDALYKLTGRVTNRTDITDHKFDLATYGNFDLVDATGNVYVYGVMTPEMQSKKFATLGVKEGDIITIIGKRAKYKELEQVGSAYYIEHQTVTKIDAASFNKLADDANAWYELTGIVTDGTAQDNHKFDLTTYGNFDLVDASGDVYVYGLSTGWNGVSKQCASIGIKAGDELTIVAHKASYKGASQAGNAWYVSHVSK